MGPEKTILLKDIRILETGTLATDHLWFTCGKTFDRLRLNAGDQIAFNARVGQYEKGYKGRTGQKRIIISNDRPRPKKYRKPNNCAPLQTVRFQT